MTSPAKNLLEGVTVVDLTTFLSGPYATQILGDLGAEVIKVESPGAGDPTRILPPYFVEGDSAYFHSINRNKKSVVLDLKSRSGLATLCDIIAKADILVENFRPGVMARLGLTDERIKAANSRLVWCSLTGFGTGGPYEEFPAYDMIVQALSGGMSMTGPAGGPAVRAGVPIGDLSAGMFSVIGILAALGARDKSGTGSRVDVSMLDCQISMLCYQAQYHIVSGNVPGPQGSGHDSIPTYRSFVCGDGDVIVVTANNEKMWASLCAVLGCEQLVADPRFATNSERLKNRQALWAELEAAFLKFSARDLFLKLMSSGVPAAPINDVAEALKDPQVLARGMLVQATAPDHRKIDMVGNPIRVNGRDVTGYSHPPRLGEHTVSVLRDLLHYDQTTIDSLLQSRSAEQFETGRTE